MRLEANQLVLHKVVRCFLCSITSDPIDPIDAILECFKYLQGWFYGIVFQIGALRWLRNFQPSIPEPLDARSWIKATSMLYYNKPSKILVQNKISLK